MGKDRKKSKHVSVCKDNQNNNNDQEKEETEEEELKMPVLPSLPFLLSNYDPREMEARRKKTADLREKWRKQRREYFSRDIEEERKRRYSALPPRKPISGFQFARTPTSVEWVHSDPHFMEKWRENFHHKFTTQIKKASTTPRINYVRNMRPETPPMKEFLLDRSNTETTIFYTSKSPQPTNAKEKEMKTRHFVDPTWKSEGISWTRFNDGKVRQYHRYTLF